MTDFDPVTDMMSGQSYATAEEDAMRLAHAEYWSTEEKRRVETVGKFHQWAPKYDECQSGPGNYTVALVEEATGQIRECFPDTVRFIEKGDTR